MRPLLAAAALLLSGSAQAITGSHQLIVLWESDPRIMLTQSTYTLSGWAPQDSKEYQCFFGQGPTACAANPYNPTESIAARFKEQSYGRLDLSGRVYYFTDGCAGDHISVTQGFEYVMTVGCAQANSGGQAGVGGFQSQVNSYDVSDIVHELGHNFGMQHAGVITCSGPMPADPLRSSSCSVQQYGDPFDPTGHSMLLDPQFNAFHRFQMGWLDAVDVLDVAASGSYTVAPITAGSGIRAIRIAKPSVTWGDAAGVTRQGAHDYFELLTPAGGRPTATARLGDMLPGGNGDNTLLIGSWTTPNHTMVVDAGDGFTVTLTALSAAGATFQVQFGGTPPAPPAPASVAVSAAPAEIQSGQSATISAVVTDQNGSAMTGQAVIFNLVGGQGTVSAISASAASYSAPSTFSGQAVVSGCVAGTSICSSGASDASITVTPPAPTCAVEAASGLSFEPVSKTSVMLRWTPGAGAAGQSVVFNGGAPQTLAAGADRFGPVSVSANASYSWSVTETAPPACSQSASSSFSMPQLLAIHWTPTTGGTHTLTVKAYSTDGQTGQASVAGVAVPAAPEVTVSSPADGSTLGGTVEVQAQDCAAAGAAVTRVELFEGGPNGASVDLGAMTLSEAAP